MRPHGTETPLERSQGLVRNNYQSGIFGGITMAQYQQIAHIPGVQVAAPIAMIGYVLQPVQFNIDLTPFLTHAPRQLFTVKITRTTDRGLVHLTDKTGYVYVTKRPIDSGTGQVAGRYGNITEELASGRNAPVCPQFMTTPSPFRGVERQDIVCWSRQTGSDGSGWQYTGFRHGHVGAYIDWSYPFLLAAVDPAAEAKLDGVNRTIVDGRYLRSSDMPTVVSYQGAGRINVPVLVSTRPYIDDQSQVTISELGTAAAQTIPHSPTPRRVARVIATASPGMVVQRRSFGVGQAYHSLLVVCPSFS